MSLIKLVWPEEYEDYKVVQVKFDNRSAFLFGNPWKYDEVLQGYILRNFLMGEGITYEPVFGRLSGENIPKISGERYQVLGMGQASIMPEDKTANFFGSSGDYGIGLDQNQLYQLRKQEKDWKIEIPRIVRLF